MRMGWSIVVSGVEDVVKKEKIQKRTSEITCMIVWMFYITYIVLKIVSAHNAPCRKVMRNNHE